MELASHYAPGNVSNLMTLKQVAVQEVVKQTIPVPDTEELVQTLSDILPGEPIKVHEVGSAIVLSGQVSSQAMAQQALQVAQLFAQGAQISNLLTVAEAKTCVVRTRKGDETIETNVACRDQG